MEPAGVPMGPHACFRPGAASGSEVYKPEREAAAGVVEGAGCLALIPLRTSRGNRRSLTPGKLMGTCFFLATAKLALEKVDDSLRVFDAHDAPPNHPACRNRPRGRRRGITKPPAKPRRASSLIFGASGSATFNGPGDPTPPLPPARNRRR